MATAFATTVRPGVEEIMENAHWLGSKTPTGELPDQPFYFFFSLCSKPTKFDPLFSVLF